MDHQRLQSLTFRAVCGDCGRSALFRNSFDRDSSRVASARRRAATTHHDGQGAAWV